MKTKETSTYDDYLKLLEEELNHYKYKYSIWQVWQDWLSLMAISISNSVEYHDIDKRNEEYHSIISKYEKADIEKFAKMFSYVACGLEACGVGKYRDMLGELYHRLKLNNENNGEFFTPLHISEFMAEVVIGDSEDKLIKDGYLSFAEPTCGSGVMVIASANSLMKKGYDVSKSMIAICTDINLICVKMCYIQLSLIGVPAVVVHGNTLTCEEWGRWYTPTHCWRNWVFYFTGGKYGRLLTEQEHMVESMKELFRQF